MVGGTLATPHLGLDGGGTPHHQDLARVPPTLGWGTPHHQDLVRVPPP